MPWQLWAFFVLAAIWIVAVVVKKSRTDPEEKSAAKGAVWVFGLLAALMLVLSSLTMVGTRNIGIQTSFNRPVGTLSNGIHLKEPWTKIVEWDGKLQNLAFENNNENAYAPGIQTRLGNQSVATVDLLLQYKLTTDDGVLELFRSYGSEESLKRNLVAKNLQSSINLAFADFDPIVALAQTSNRTATTGMPELSKEAETSLKAAMPAGIEIISLTIIMPHYDQQTEDRIKAFNTAVQDTAIATQREETAKAINRANAILAASQATPQVLYQNCLDMVERAAKAGGNLPAGFSCSDDGAVVIPAK